MPIASRAPLNLYSPFRRGQLTPRVDHPLGHRSPVAVRKVHGEDRGLRKPLPSHLCHPGVVPPLPGLSLRWIGKRAPRLVGGERVDMHHVVRAPRGSEWEGGGRSSALVR